MCWCLDEGDSVSEDRLFDEKHCVWGLLLLLLAGVTVAAVLAGVDYHTDNVQNADWDQALSDTAHSEVVVDAIASETYYGVYRDGDTGQVRRDHVPGSVVMPKSGVLYDSTYCVESRGSAFGTVLFTKQFELDTRGVGGAPNPTRYYSLEIVFEVPFGNVLDQETGAGYLGYAGDYDNDAPPPERGRCGYPLCPRYETLSGVDGSAFDESSPYANAYQEHRLLRGTLFERTRAVHDNATYVYDETPVATRVSCSCTAERPPRFSCKFSAAELNDRRGHYVLDVAFRYLLKPKNKTPLYP